jgi:ParB family transcriptional regulator, chromosome partitioning protein
VNKKRLGRGLSSLLGSEMGGFEPSALESAELLHLAVDRIDPNPFQPRREFDPAEIAALADSLRQHGMLQPILVRSHGERYQLIAGERRLRAATNLGWTEITAIVREFDDRSMLVLALVENLQRANLNAIEEARGYRRLINDFQLTQQQVADAVGRDRTTVTNLLRILSLPDPVQRMVEQGTLSSGHARALLALSPPNSPLDLANDVVANGWSVRELEQRVRNLGGGQPLQPKARQTTDKLQPRPTDPAVRRVEDDLRRHFQTDVRLSLSGESQGKIELSFYSGEDLERILDLILGNKRRDF